MPAGSGRKRGRGPQHLANLLSVVDLLLDLADTSSVQGWKTIKANTKENEYKDLQQALIVRWDMNRLLVSSSRKDPDQDERESISGRHTSIGSLEAIRRCLKATEQTVIMRKLNLQGRKADTSEADFATEQIRNALNNLADLNLREDTESRNPRAPRANSPYWSFWIIFPRNCKESKRDCLAFIEMSWKEGFQRPEGQEAQQLGSQVESRELAETKQRLDKLDRWIQDNLNGWRTRFEARQEVRDRSIHVPLTTAINLLSAEITAAEQTPQIHELRPEDIQVVVAGQGSQMLLIWEEGGAGKTSLAFEICRWGLDRKLAEHVLLPILLDPSPGKGDLVERVQEQLSHVDRSIRVDDVRDLLSHRRLLVIVDHFSECTMAQRQWLIEHCHPQEIDLLLLTSRQQERSHFGGWLISTIQPQRLQDESLFRFFENYLVERGKRAGTDHSTAPLLSPDDQVRTRDLLERMVGNKPITVLLAWMVIDKAIEHIQNGRVDLLPSSVPELMLNYVERCSIAVPVEGQYLEGEPKAAVGSALIETILKKLALAAHEQNDAYKPQNFGLKLARGVLANICSNETDPPASDKPLRLLRYLEKKLNLLQEKGRDSSGPVYRISLDPLADYMAGLALIEKLTTPPSPGEQLRAVQGWLGQLSGQLELENRDRRSLMRGFLSACRDVSKDWLARLPEGLDPSLREQWHHIPLRFAQLAGIDPQEERRLEARHLIRRHAGDLAWANPELRPKALAELIAYAGEFADLDQLGELEDAVEPLKIVLQKSSLPERDRAAAAETLGLIGSQKATEALERIIDNDHELNVGVRRAAAEALGLVASHGDDRMRHWDRLVKMLTADSLQKETNPDRIAAVLPLLQGASRGLQRLASRKLPLLSSGDPLEVPMLTLTTSAGAVTTQVVRIPVWQLSLPGGLPLELVEVQGGQYQIGSLAEEEKQIGHYIRLSHPPRTLKTSGFFLARYPLSQAQWRSLADPCYAVRRQLKAYPARNKGLDLPVVGVSWCDAGEWCFRLQKYLQQKLAGLSLVVRLPSESEWEAACRAGSITSFHFGDTIDTSWANYNGNYFYPGGKKGSDLGRITPVGAYGLVNSIGLADLHGNVNEFCQEASHNHSILLEEPKDGMQWEEYVSYMSESRYARGGSWASSPFDCRASSTTYIGQGDVDDATGFRPGFFTRRQGLRPWPGS
jgi:formylglycine-generating enzyme required for sulfatase activity